MTKTQFQIEKPSDLDRLKEIIRDILGEVCWEPHLGYGDELKLEIGAKLPPLKGGRTVIEQGVWMLGARATDWKLFAPDGLLVTSTDDPELIKQKIQAVKDTPIVAFEISYPELAVKVIFGNSHTLIITPNAETQEADELSYWELFTPDCIVEVGPGLIWTYTGSQQEKKPIRRTRS